MICTFPFRSLLLSLCHYYFLPSMANRRFSFVTFDHGVFERPSSAHLYSATRSTPPPASLPFRQTRWCRSVGRLAPGGELPTPARGLPFSLSGPAWPGRRRRSLEPLDGCARRRSSSRNKSA